MAIICHSSSVGRAAVGATRRQLLSIRQARISSLPQTTALAKHRTALKAQATTGGGNDNAGGKAWFCSAERVGGANDAALLAVVGAMGCVVASTTIPTSVSCCEGEQSVSTGPSSSREEESAGELPDNPLWPSGISKEDVDDFVEGVMNDPNINIASVPDSFERLIYTTTVSLTLNAVYQCLGSGHGMEVLGHEFRMHRISESKTQRRGLRRPKKDGTDDNKDENVVDHIDERLLEEVADRLLDNRAVNLSFVPDAVERQLYSNCLKLVFRILDMVFATFKMTVCGHDIQVNFSPTLGEASLRRAAAASSGTKIDVEALERLARDTAREFARGDDGEEADNGSWWSRLVNPSRDAFLESLISTIFALVLGILDDFLANTELELLSDRILIDIVPMSSGRTGTKMLGDVVAEISEKKEELKEELTTMSAKMGVQRARTGLRDDRSSSFVTVRAAFVAGVGVGMVATVGLTTMAVWGGKTR